jgi:hypothetical protein
MKILGMNQILSHDPRLGRGHMHVPLSLDTSQLQSVLHKRKELRGVRWMGEDHAPFLWPQHPCERTYGSCWPTIWKWLVPILVSLLRDPTGMSQLYYHGDFHMEDCYSGLIWGPHDDNCNEYYFFFWDVTLCTPVEVQHFRGHCIHLDSSQASSKHCKSCTFLVSLSASWIIFWLTTILEPVTSVNTLGQDIINPPYVQC